MEEKERYELIGYCSYRDTETGVIGDNFVELLNQQDQKIKDLEHRLANCIEPKFKIGQEVWFVNKRNGYDAQIECGKIENLRIFALKSKIQINYRICDSNCSWYDRHSYRQKELFATEEEARAKLRS